MKFRTLVHVVRPSYVGGGGTEEGKKREGRSK
jgi:hypothetical protein